MMKHCSYNTGVPLDCIFPVKCYHEEIDLNKDMDVLLLSALKHILNPANDHVADKTGEVDVLLLSALTHILNFANDHVAEMKIQD
ncbi:hypothetical protein AALO_G00090940 [Alosa alosa]|uniref:Uncharacterized protein n=1 Tax=Alosa alosa TaxID=278164 RepID=A0AAV6GWJ0_9TELE|nr:hypothetical protein AALO_G00090940 [Alosa alosa]